MQHGSVEMWGCTDIIAEENCLRSSVIKARHATEPLLSGCIPYLQPDDGIRGGIEDALCDKRRADG
jgi:hypothetical protein